VNVARTPWAAACWRRYFAGCPAEGPPERHAGRAGGYSVLRAVDMDSAVALVRDHPFVKRGGSLQVTEAVSP